MIHIYLLPEKLKFLIRDEMCLAMYHFGFENPDCYLYSGTGIDTDIRFKVTVNTVPESSLISAFKERETDEF